MAIPATGRRPGRSCEHAAMSAIIVERGGTSWPSMAPPPPLSIRAASCLWDSVPATLPSSTASRFSNSAASIISTRGRTATNSWGAALPFRKGKAAPHELVAVRPRVEMIDAAELEKRLAVELGRVAGTESHKHEAALIDNGGGGAMLGQEVPPRSTIIADIAACSHDLPGRRPVAGIAIQSAYTERGRG